MLVKRKCMKIEQLYKKLRKKVSEWEGRYYIYAGKNNDGITIGPSGKGDTQQVGIEILENNHPDDIESQLKPLIETTDWTLYDDGLLKEGYSQSNCEIFLRRDIESPGFEGPKKFENSDKI